MSFTSFARIEGTGTAQDAVWVATSADGGRGISTPVAATDPFAYQVRLAADPVRDGRVHLAWVEARETLRWGFVDSGDKSRAHQPL